MSQNTSSAVMAQRVEPPDSLDFFPTPPWGTRALCNFLEGEVGCLDGLSCWEPACGEGHMVRPLKEYFRVVRSSDVHDYGVGPQERVSDFLIPWDVAPCIEAQGVDWVITNPPFRLAMEFALTAIRRARNGVALLVRTAFLESGSRYTDLFDPHPPAYILQFCERLPMHKGRLDPKGSTATAYCWVVWAKGHSGDTRFRWIPPCRRAIERPGDYA